MAPAALPKKRRAAPYRPVAELEAPVTLPKRRRAAAYLRIADLWGPAEVKERRKSYARKTRLHAPAEVEKRHPAFARRLGDLEAPVALPRRRSPWKRTTAFSLVAHLFLLLAAGTLLPFHMKEREEAVFDVEVLRLRPFRERMSTEPRAVPLPDNPALRMPPLRDESVLLRRPPRRVPLPPLVLLRPPRAVPLPRREAAPTAVPRAAPAAPSPVPEKTPSGSPAAPGTPGAVESPAGLALAIEYRNDERIPRDAKGGIVLTPEVLEELRNVKPILVAVPDLTVPPEKAGELGVSPGLTVTARVAITLTMPRGGFGAPVLMAPTAIAVTDLRREPPPPLTAQQQSALESFIRGKMAETRWFPALDQGVPEETSTETFDVEIAGSEAAAPAGTGKGTPARVPESPGTKAPGGPGPGGTGTNAPPGAVKAPGRPEATKAAPEGAKTPGPSEGPGTKTPGAPGPEPSKERPAEPSPPTPGPPGGDEKKGTP